MYNPHLYCGSGKAAIGHLQRNEQDHVLLRLDLQNWEEARHLASVLPPPRWTALLERSQKPAQMPPMKSYSPEAQGQQGALYPVRDMQEIHVQIVLT